jgi:hypothetical protein
VLPSLHSLGSRKERMGPGEAHATYSVPSASSMRHTADSSVDAKSRGEVGRGQRLMNARGQRGESDGASSSDPRQAGDTRRRTDGAGP